MFSSLFLKKYLILSSFSLKFRGIQLGLIYLSIVIVVLAIWTAVAVIAVRMHLCSVSLNILVILIRVVGIVRRVLIGVRSSEIVRRKDTIDRLLAEMIVVLIFLVLLVHDEWRVRGKYECLVSRRGKFIEHFICIVACFFD